LEKWQPTAEYLSRQIPGSSFTVVPLAFEQIAPTVKDSRIDFLLTNSSIYVEMEIHYGARRIATLKNIRFGRPVTVFGGVIFTTADRNDINKLYDLRGKRFMGVNEHSLGGWRAAWRELKLKGIDPYKDFADLAFGGTHDAVVYAVRDGRADAGCVRTDTLERMAAEGKIDISDFHFIHDHKGDHREYKDGLYSGDTFEDYCFIHSTRLYPEWPFVQLKHIPDSLAEKVALSLLSMPSGSPAANAAHCAGWTIPHNYQSVRDGLKELKIGPYKDYGKVTLSGVIKQYWPWFVGFTIIGIVIAVAIVNILVLNRRLLSTKKELEDEITENKRQKIEMEQLNSRIETSVEKANALAQEVTVSNFTLNERVRELDCLYSLSRVIEKSELSLDEVFREAVELVPTGCHELHSICARIIFNGRKYNTGNFRKTPSMIIADIICRGKKTGCVEVCCMSGEEPQGESHFSMEEKRLLDEIADRLGLMASRRQTDEMVKANNDFLESVMEGVTNAIYVIDLEGNFTLISRANSKITGYAVDELVGQPFSVLLEGDALLELNKQFNRVKVLGTTVSQIETEFVRKDGIKVFVSINLSPLYEDDKIVSVVGTAEDITRRKELERRLLQAHKLESVGQLASGIAHEINTPTQYVGDNVRFLQESFTDMAALLQ
ncbi:MAG: PhnD/SsuA/transferrin family substrate-binding protein, partial [Sedimentisphaerales bacterium]|nr:PhnD/SsuA/transferrin family substrate-binding protein [Sedimentisphaerales bacterium]